MEPFNKWLPRRVAGPEGRGRAEDGRSKVRKWLSSLSSFSLFLSLSVSRISWCNLIPWEGREENRAATYPYTLIIRVDPPRLGSHLPRFALAFTPSPSSSSSIHPPFLYLAVRFPLSFSRHLPSRSFSLIHVSSSDLDSECTLKWGRERGREKERVVNVEQTEQVDSGDDTLRANESSWNSSSRPWQSNLRFKLVASVFLVRITERRRDCLLGVVS